jgi:ubiquinone/menaquinone biosynthesis C-methylase UbiE
MSITNRIELLPRDELRKTSEVDHADWNYRPILGLIIRQRYEVIRSFLANGRFDRILEVGYGSGVFMPELSRRCRELYGIDIHQWHESVMETLARHQVTAKLVSGTAEAMPFGDDDFDCVVAASSLEFIPDLKLASQEIARVLRPDGFLVAVTPGFSPLVDLGLKILTGASAETDYGNRRRAVLPTLLRFFSVQEQRTVPRVGRSIVHLYTGLKLSPRKQSD